MSELGPVEYLIVAFPGNKFRGEIAPALGDLVEAGTIRLMDIAFVGKDEDGTAVAFELSDIDPDVREGLENLGVEPSGLFSEEDLAAAAEELEPNTSAALLVWEDVWAREVAEAMRAAGASSSTSAVSRTRSCRPHATTHWQTGKRRRIRNATHAQRTGTRRNGREGRRRRWSRWARSSPPATKVCASRPGRRRRAGGGARSRSRSRRSTGLRHRARAPSKASRSRRDQRRGLRSQEEADPGHLGVVLSDSAQSWRVARHPSEAPLTLCLGVCPGFSTHPHTHTNNKPD